MDSTNPKGLPPKSNSRFEFVEAYAALKKDFPKEALSTDSSRGFALTSVKAQYVVERLNETLGIDGWSHRGEYKLVDDGVVFEGSLILDNGEKAIMQSAAGFSKIKKNIGDAYKSAKTDSLSKCASLFGVANNVYKGKVAAPGAKVTKAKTVSKGDF